VTNVRYIIDGSGHKTAVVLLIEEYEEMLEDLHLSETYRASKDEPKRDFLELVEKCAVRTRSMMHKVTITRSDKATVRHAISV
jgi:hypothetical protein